MDRNKIIDLVGKVFCAVNDVDTMVDKMNCEMDDLMPDCKIKEEVIERLKVFGDRDNQVDLIRSALVDVLDELEK